MKDHSRRSFIKTSAATGITFTFAGLIRAHGQSGGGTTWNPEATLGATFGTDVTTTWNQEATYVATTWPGSYDTTTWDSLTTVTTSTEFTTSFPEETTTVTETTEAEGVWKPNEEVHTIELEIDRVLLLTAMAAWLWNNNYRKNSLGHPIDVIYLQSAINIFTANKFTLQYTIKWDTYHKPENAPPSKYRRLSWNYLTNPMFFVNAGPPPAAPLTLQNPVNGQYGYRGFIQASLPGDVWRLGTCSLNASTVVRAINGTTTATTLIGVPLPLTLPTSWYYPALPPGDQATASHGGCFNAGMEVETSGNWDGNNDVGVDSFEFLHRTAIMCNFLAQFMVWDFNLPVPAPISLTHQEMGILRPGSWLRLAPVVAPRQFNPQKVVKRANSTPVTVTLAGSVMNDAGITRWQVEVR